MQIGFGLATPWPRPLPVNGEDLIALGVREDAEAVILYSGRESEFIAEIRVTFDLPLVDSQLVTVVRADEECFVIVHPTAADLEPGLSIRLKNGEGDLVDVDACLLAGARDFPDDPWAKRFMAAVANPWNPEPTLRAWERMAFRRILPVAGNYRKGRD